MKVQRLGFKAALRASLAAVFIIAMLLSTALPAGAIASTVGNATGPMLTAGNVPDFAGTNGGENLLQFTSAGYVLGFSRDGVFIGSAGQMLRTRFVNASAVAPQAEDCIAAVQAPGMAPPLGRVTYRDVWDGVTVVYEAMEGTIVESIYYVDTVADIIPGSNIRLSYNRPLTIDDQGNLVIAYESGNMVESAPVAWQEIDGQRTPVTVAYALYGQHEVGFSLGDFKPGVPVVIDPALTSNTFLGGSGYDCGTAIAVDGSGNVYVAGYSQATWGAPVRNYTADYDAFVTKRNSSGALLWNTFLGGGGDDKGNSIAVDGSGNVYVAGYSLATWKGTSNPLRAYTNQSDAFAAKLNNSGALLWNTFLGGILGDEGRAIAVDGSGNVYVAGFSEATWKGASDPVRAFTGTDYDDAFAAKLNTSGTLLWNTFLGGGGTDEGRAIAVDGSGNVYVAGDSYATWKGASDPLRACTTATDVFAAKLNTSGALLWNTFLGGSGSDHGYGIAVDGSGNVYVAGDSEATWGAPLRAYTASVSDAFAARLNGSGTLLWNTFLGGSSTEYGRAIAVTGIGNVYVAGTSFGTWGTPLRAYTAGVADAFAARLNNSGALLWNTFLGGSAIDCGFGIALDGNENINVAGYSTGTWGSPVRAYTTSSADGFVATVSTMNPVSGNWNGTGGMEIGTYLNGTWYLDYNGNGVWNGGVIDRQYTFGNASQKPVTGDWNSDNKTEIGSFYNGTWYLDYNGNGVWNGGVIDRQYTFGSASMTPVSGDWNGDNKTEIGTFYNGTWYLDYSGNGVWGGVAGGDRQYTFGNASMTPVSGDWNNDRKTEIGAFYNGTWYLDYSGNGVYGGVAGGDRQYSFGNASQKPVSGNWNGTGGTEIGAFLSGTWYLDYNANGAWNGGVIDRQYSFGN